MNIGERIGDYEIVEVLGAGGMGQVYKVRNVISDRMEAMKVLLPNLEGDPDLADRFLREIKVQAALDHPNIAKLNTAMRADNQLVMVMEFVNGTSLAQVLEQGPIPATAVVSYIAQVLDALAYAHARGVIHRDIKPANIMLVAPGGEHGTIKLMDFGIARMKADRQLTQTGSTVGSLFYMSPEQIKGGAPDPRSDLYSVGITMYEMVTGRRPFLGDSDFSIMSAHMQQAPAAPIEIIPGVPPVVNDLILMAIEKDPAARFQSAAAFRAALGSAFPQAVASSAATRTMNVVVPPSVVPPSVVPSVMTPPPMPQAAPPPMPQAAAMMPPPVQATTPPPAKSRRGLYMALGSVATLAVLVGAVVEGPKFLHGGASGAQSVNPGEPGQPAGTVGSLVPPPNGDAVAVVVPASPAGIPQSSPAPEPMPRAVQPPAYPATAPPAVVPQLRSAAAPQQPAVAQPQPAVAPPVLNVPAAQQPPTINTATPEMKELRDRINRVSSRASAAQTGVRSIEQNIQSQGMGLRGDIKAASIRLDYLLQEARTSLQNGDVDGAKRNLQYAEGTLSTIEKFLGY